MSNNSSTVVDNVIWANRDDLTKEALSVYGEVGLRVIYARMFTDISLSERVPLVSILQRKEPAVRKALFPKEETEVALLAVEELIRKRIKNIGDLSIHVEPY